MKTVIGFVKALDQLNPGPPRPTTTICPDGMKSFILIYHPAYMIIKCALIAALHLLILLSVSFICKYFLRTLKRFS